MEDILWEAFGTGTLTDTDAASIAALGDTDPTAYDFSAAAQAKVTWFGESATYLTGP